MSKNIEVKILVSEKKRKNNQSTENNITDINERFKPDTEGLKLNAKSLNQKKE